jgi:hypothetical protein
VNRAGWWELEVVATKLGFSRRDHLLALVNRLISRGILNTSEFSRERGRIAGERGQPRKLVFLAPSAVVAISAHAATPEAAAFRNAALARLSEMPANALPAAPVDAPPDFAHLAARVAQLEARLAPVEVRVEKLEAREPQQLMLPGTWHERGDLLGAGEWLARRTTEFTLDDLIEGAKLSKEMLTQGGKQKLGVLLARLGWCPVRRVRHGGQMVRFYARPLVVESNSTH